MDYKKINFIIYIFALTFGVILYNPIGREFRYIDEGIIAFLVLYWITNPKFVLKKEFLLFSGIALFYLLYTFMYPINVNRAIWMDFFLQIKPYLAFYSIYQIDFTFYERDKQAICRFCLLAAVLILPYGLLYFGQYLMGIFYLPAHFATMMEILGISYLTFSKKRKKDLIISILIMSIGLLSLRSKFFGFFTIYIGILLFWDPNKRYKIFTFKNIFIFTIILGIALYFAWNKIYFYFVIGSSLENMMARPYMYYMAGVILNDYPLLGTGLGTYASYASSLFYSPLYYMYKMNENYEIGNNLYVMDAFYPSLIQYGLVGIYFFILFWRKRYHEIKQLYKVSHNTTIFKLSLLIVVFFGLESFVDSTFIQNRGMMMMMIFAILLKKEMSHEETTHYSNNNYY